MKPSARPRMCGVCTERLPIEGLDVCHQCAVDRARMHLLHCPIHYQNQPLRGSRFCFVCNHGMKLADTTQAMPVVPVGDLKWLVRTLSGDWLIVSATGCECGRRNCEHIRAAAAQFSRRLATPTAVRGH